MLKQKSGRLQAGVGLE